MQYIVADGRTLLVMYHLRVLAVVAILCVFQWSAANAQSTPPIHDTVSPTGVSYRNGAFTMQEVDLSIGGGFPNGLELSRSYNSSLPGYSYPFMGQGWLSSLNIYVMSESLPRHPGYDEGQQYIVDRCIYKLVGGPASLGFHNLDDNPTVFHPSVTFYGCGGNIQGTYVSAGSTGDKLEFVGPQHTGYFLYKGHDGSVIKFLPGQNQADYWIMADGTRLDFTYSNSRLASVFSSRGWAILIESSGKSCAVNRAAIYVTSTSACPPGVQTVSYSYGAGTYSPYTTLLLSSTKAGATRTYGYGGNDLLNCVIDPGQTACRIQNTYERCPEDPYLGSHPQPHIRRHDPVISQLDGGGRTFTYSLSEEPCPYPVSSQAWDTRPVSSNSSTMTESGVPGTVVTTTLPSGQILTFKDPLDRVLSYTYVGPVYGDACCGILDWGGIATLTYPEGNSIEYIRDDRGNVKIEKVKPKTGSETLDTVFTYPPSPCTINYSCNKPLTRSDPANTAVSGGNITTYTYDTANHGGMLTETSPADANGLRQVKRYSYVQRTAWLKTSAGGYAAASPVWVLAAMKTCGTSATLNDACAAGSADEIVTEYDYGPDSGPNNLLLRGQAVTAASTTLRTCYSYDMNGRRISETSPNANLTSCP